MPYRSLLVVQLVLGTRDEAVAAYHERRVLDECKDAIAEFIGGRVCLSETDPDRICIEVDWASAQGWHDWMDHPVRAAQAKDIGRFVQSIILSDVYEI